MFLAWAIHRGLVGDLHEAESREALDAVRRRAMTGRQFLFNICDEKFWSDDLNDEGNAFAMYYYDSHTYYADYEATLARELPTLYHVADTWESYDRIGRVIDRRYYEWKRRRSKHWWEFWK